MILAEVWFVALLSCSALLAGCGAHSTSTAGDGDVDVDSDADSDGDADADSDADADGDGQPLVVEPGCVIPTSEAPEVVGSIDLIADWQPGVKGFPEHFQFDVAGDLAAVNLDLGGFALVDVADRTSPVVVGGADVQNPSWGGVALVGDYALTLGEPSGGAIEERFALNVFDISDAAVPVLIGQVGLAYPPRAIGLLDTETAIVGLGGTRDAGVHIVDFADPGMPRIVASSDPLPTGAIAVIDDLAVVAGDPRLEVLDVSGHRQLSPVGFQDIPCLDVAASATEVYALSADNWIHIFLMNDPDLFESPWSTTSYEVVWTAIAATGGVVVAGGQSTLESLDVVHMPSTTDAIPPASIEVPSQAGIERIVAKGHYAYVLTGDLRLTIVDLHCEMP